MVKAGPSLFWHVSAIVVGYVKRCLITEVLRQLPCSADEFVVRRTIQRLPSLAAGTVDCETCFGRESCD